MKKICFLILNLILILNFPATIFSQTTLTNPSKENILKLENSIKAVPQRRLLNNFAEENVSSKKSVGLAILFSAILPGMGELYAGNYSSGKYFTAAEGALWGIYYGLDTYSSWQKDRYMAYAASAAGVNLQGKDATFFSTIADYLNIDEYNNSMALSQDFSAMYNSSKNYWRWQSNTDRKTYRNMWVNGEQANNSLRFVVGALILNRIASIINAVRLVAAYNKRSAEKLSWNVSVGVKNYNTLPSSLNLNFNTSF